MKAWRKGAVGVAMLISVIGLNTSAAWAYLGETAYLSCGSGRTIQTKVIASYDHHHRVNGVNYDLPGGSSTVTQSFKVWGSQSGQWTTGTYYGSYSYESGGSCVL